RYLRLPHAGDYPGHPHDGKQRGTQKRSRSSTTLISYFIESKERFAKISKPFSPDIIVYCKSELHLYRHSEGTEAILETARKEIEAYKAKYGYAPKVILIKGIGLVAVGDNAAGCNIIAEVYQDMMKTPTWLQSFGG
ncbi:MAG: hypothetical protein ACLR8Y_17250, partial [Alistipes indistinctus]